MLQNFRKLANLQPARMWGPTETLYSDDSTSNFHPPVCTEKFFYEGEREKLCSQYFQKRNQWGFLAFLFSAIIFLSEAISKIQLCPEIKDKGEKNTVGSQGWIFPRCYLNIQRGSSKNIFSYFTHYLNFICLPFISLNICSCQSRICITVTKAWEIYSCLDPISDQSNQSF